MNVLRLFFLPLVIFIYGGIKQIICNTYNHEASNDMNSRFVETKATKSSSVLPGVFDLFSNKINESTQPQINLFLVENSNRELHRNANNEKLRNMRKRFADFQELRQNDILRFQELMVVQNEQINMLKNIILSLQK